MECVVYSKVMRISYVIAICFVVGFVAPWFINQRLEFTPESHEVEGTCHIMMGLRMNCFPDLPNNQDINQTSCESRGCCYQELNLEYNGPVCHRKIPSLHSMRVLKNEKGGSEEERPYNDSTADLEYSHPDNLQPWPFTNLTEATQRRYKYRIRSLAPHHLEIHIHQGDIEDEEGDFIGHDESGWDIQDLRVETVLSDNRLALRIWRNESGLLPLLDLSYGSVIISDTYSEFSLMLPSPLVYGSGAGSLSFASNATESANFQKSWLYNSERSSDGVLHSHPIFMGMDDGRLYYGIYLETGGAGIEIEAMPGLDNSQRPLLVYRVMSDFLRLHLLTGPKPKDVMTQLTTASSSFFSSVTPLPKWALGYFLCRDTGNRDRDSELLSFDLKYMEAGGIPFDGDCISQGLMSTAFQVKNAETRSTSIFPTDLKKLSDAGKKFLLAQPPHVDSQLMSEFFLKNEVNASIDYQANFKGIPVHLPDFQANLTLWWGQQMTHLIKNSLNDTLPDGFILIHNSPLLDNSTCLATEDLSFSPEKLLGNGTICPLAMHFNGRAHIKMHNDYGLGHAKASRAWLASQNSATAPIFSMTSSPGFTRSDIPLAGNYSTQWSEMQRNLRDVLELSLAGIPLVSMSGCGTFTALGKNDSNELSTAASASADSESFLSELCTRWYQMAAYMPTMYSFYQDDRYSRLPFSFGQTAARNIRYAIERRIKLMPYIMTQLTDSPLPLIRPMIWEFPEADPHWPLHLQPQWQQFMFGPSILVAPILAAGAATVDVYFPRGSWYELWSGLNYSDASTLGRWQKIEAVPYQIPSYIRGGSILPTLTGAENSLEESYEKFNWSMMVALECASHAIDPKLVSIEPDCIAEGQLWLEEETNAVVASLEASMNAMQGQFNIGNEAFQNCNIAEEAEAEALGMKRIVDTITIYGAAWEPHQVTVNGATISPDSLRYAKDIARLDVFNVTTDLCTESGFNMTWVKLL